VPVTVIVAVKLVYPERSPSKLATVVVVRNAGHCVEIIGNVATSPDCPVAAPSCFVIE